MTRGVPGWSPDLERSFKEVLYRFLEEVQSTKAALYLLSPDGGYVLVAQYGFGRRDLLAAEIDAREALILRCRELRARPQAFNHPEEFPEISHYLEGAGTARLLLVPLWAGSRLLGFVDARDKGRKRSFEASDLERAAAIASSFLDLLRQAGLYGEVEATSTIPALAMPLAGRATEGVPDAEPVLDQRGLEQVKRALAGFCQRPAINGVALAIVEPPAAATLLYLRQGEVIDAEAVVSHQRESLRQGLRGRLSPATWRVEALPLAIASGGAKGRLIATAVLLSSPGWALLGSVVGALGAAAVQETIEEMRRAAEVAREGSRLRYVRRQLARRLLQPRSDEWVELAAHSLVVSRLASRLARDLGLPEPELELAALAGLIHDIGMHELGDPRLYRLPAPGAEERRLYQLHVLHGERLARSVGMLELAPVVRHHHERWDGRGYPDQLAGEEIPVLARAVHVAEVYDVLTSPTSYRRQVTSHRAVDVLRSAAGQQFDRELVERLARMV